MLQTLDDLQLILNKIILIPQQFDMLDGQMIVSGYKIFQDRLSDTRAIFNLPCPNNIKRATGIKDLSIQTRLMCMNLQNVKGSGELNCKILMKQLGKFEEVLNNLSNELLKAEVVEKNEREMARLYEVPPTPVFDIQKVDKEIQIEDQTEIIIKELSEQRKEYQQIIRAFKQSSDEDQKLIDELVDENQKFKTQIEKLVSENKILSKQVEDAEDALGEILTLKQ